MKNSLKTILLTLIIFAGFTAFANLPELGSLTSSEPNTLPDTASASNGDVYIDMDGDGDTDFTVDYNLITEGNYTRYQIYSESSLGRVLIDGEPSHTSPALNENGPLMVVAVNDVSVFEQGESIESTAPDGSSWYYSGIIFKIYDTASGSALQSTFYDSREGYVGVRYDDGDGNLYGWIHLKVDEEENEVIVLSAGSAGSVGEPVAAGAGDPYGAASVPVPFIASFLGLLLVGVGSYVRKKRK